MPDMERMLRSLSEHVASTIDEQQYTKGFHDGMDKARWQIVKLCAGIAIGTVIYQLARIAL